VTNCTFNGNSAIAGGGMCNDSNSSPTVKNCTFSGNSADYMGGGIYNEGGSPIVTNCTFSGNSAYSYDGGGMYNQGGSPIVTNCTFSGNSASGYGSGGGYGGGMYMGWGSSTITNCTFNGNSAYGEYASYGGGMYTGWSNSTITNCTFSGNFASNGGGIYVEYGDETVEVKNCVLWFNMNEQIGGYSDSLYVTYSDIQDGWPGGNIDADPCFVELGYWDDINDPNTHDGDPNDPNAFWVDGNYRLLRCSPCIDTGNPNYSDPNNTTDLDGFPRFIDGDCNDSNIVDMGAYEFLGSDIDHSGAVNFIDFAGFALQWLESDCGLCFGADLTCDNQVEWADLEKFTEWWLAGADF